MSTKSCLLLGCNYLSNLCEMVLFYRKVIIFAILLSIPLTVSSQEDDKQNLGVWLTYKNRFKINSSFYYIDDISYRHTIVYDKWQRFSFNPAIAFNALNEIEFYFGANNLFVVQDVINNTYELRIWQGVRMTWPYIKRFHFDHYFRFEERFIYDFGDKSWNPGYRGRYRLSLTVPINSMVIAESTFYTGISAEAYTNIGKSMPEKYLDQARFSATFGYRKNRKWSFELMYLVDDSKEVKEDNFELNNHIIRFRIINIISL